MSKLNTFQIVLAATSALVTLSCLSTCCDAAKFLQSSKNDNGNNTNRRYSQYQQRRASKGAKGSDGRFYYADSGYGGWGGDGAMMILGSGKAAKAGEGGAMMMPMHDDGYGYAHDDDDDDDDETGMAMTPTLPTYTADEAAHILNEIEKLEEEEQAAAAGTHPPAEYHEHLHDHYGWDGSVIILSKAGKGTKSAKAKSSKAKSAKGMWILPHEHIEGEWDNYDDAYISSAEDDTIVAPMEDDAIPCDSKAGKDCPTLMPIPPIEWIPSAPPKDAGDIPAPSPPTDMLTMAPTPCIGDCASLPPVEVVTPTTVPPAMLGSTAPPSTGLPGSTLPPTSAAPGGTNPPVGLVPITVSPVSEAPFPTYSPTLMPSTTIQTLTKELPPPTSSSSSSSFSASSSTKSLDDVTSTSTSTSGGTWFQTGKSYDTELSQYARNRVSGEEMQMQRSSGIGDIGEQGFRDRDDAVPEVSSNGGYYVQDGNGHAVEEAVGHDNNIPLMMMGEDSVSSSSSSTTSSGGSRSALISRVVLCGGGLVAVAYSVL